MTEKEEKEDLQAQDKEEQQIKADTKVISVQNLKSTCVLKSSK